MERARVRADEERKEWRMGGGFTFLGGGVCLSLVIMRFSVTFTMLPRDWTTRHLSENLKAEIKQTGTEYQNEVGPQEWKVKYETFQRERKTKEISRKFWAVRAGHQTSYKLVSHAKSVDKDGDGLTDLQSSDWGAYTGLAMSLNNYSKHWCRNIHQ